MCRSQNLRFNKLVPKKERQNAFFFSLRCQIKFNKLVLWYLNHISTMEKKTDRVKNVVQVKPENSQDVVLETYTASGHTTWVDLDWIGAKEKPHLQRMDGWVGRWTMRKKSGRKWGVWSSSCTDVEKKWHGLEANLRSESITLLHDSPADGDQCSRRRQRSLAAVSATLKAENRSSRAECECEEVRRKSLRKPVWDQISGEKEMALFSKCVQKYLSDYCWNMNPFFFSYIFSLRRFWP